MKSIYQGMLATAVGLGVILASSVAEAADCTIANWSSADGLTNDNVGTQSDDNRRYAGPCGLRVPVSATSRYLQDNTPSTETVFNVRFYFFLNDVTNDVTIFKALASNSDSVITATYDQSASAINVEIAHTSATQTLIAEGVKAAGWNSLEIQWKADEAETAKVILANSDLTDEVIGSPVDTSGLTIDRAQLGVLGIKSGASGSIDFDDYDSRRDTVPGRLLKGDSNGDGTVNSQDFVQVINEITGSSDSEGMPDCNEDGLINSQDFVCIINTITGQ